jgi:hypothetical protein
MYTFSLTSAIFYLHEADPDACLLQPKDVPARSVLHSLIAAVDQT